MTYFTGPMGGGVSPGYATAFTLKLVNKTMLNDENILNVDGLFRKD